MTKENDNDELAKRFLDLWQDHAQAFAADLSAQSDWSKVINGFGFPSEAAKSPGDFPGHLAAQWAAWPAMMAAAAAGMNDGAAAKSGGQAGAAKGRQDRNEGGKEAASGTAAPPGAPAASAASGGGLHDLDQLLRRLDALEERLAVLEGKQARKRQSKKPRKSKSGD